MREVKGECIISGEGKKGKERRDGLNYVSKIEEDEEEEEE